MVKSKKEAKIKKGLTGEENAEDKEYSGMRRSLHVV